MTNMQCRHVLHTIVKAQITCGHLIQDMLCWLMTFVTMNCCLSFFFVTSLSLLYISFPFPLLFLITFNSFFCFPSCFMFWTNYLFLWLCPPHNPWGKQLHSKYMILIKSRRNMIYDVHMYMYFKYSHNIYAHTYIMKVKIMIWLVLSSCN